LWIRQKIQALSWGVEVNEKGVPTKLPHPQAEEGSHIAVGVVFNSFGQVLVALRTKDKLQGGFWEFPGGKVEVGETVEQALMRELLEEVGIEINSPKPLTQCWHRYKDNQVWLDVWQIHQFTGAAHGREGQQIAWVSLAELRSLPLLSGNHSILEVLNQF
jgi:8-oxo-dGTP diphosphatase